MRDEDLWQTQDEVHALKRDMARALRRIDWLTAEVQELRNLATPLDAGTPPPGSTGTP
jgi:hypothetical protein